MKAILFGPASALPLTRENLTRTRDNLEKAVLDAMTTDGWWRDDRQVVAGEVRKFYHARGEVPGAMIAMGKIPEAWSELLLPLDKAQEVEF